MARGPITKPIARPVLKKLHPATRRTPKSGKTLCGHATAKPRREKTRQKVRLSRVARNHPEKSRDFALRFAG